MKKPIACPAPRSRDRSRTFASFAGLLLGSLMTLGLFASGPSTAALDPPKPHVMGPDPATGLRTALTLEQAGILKPDGRPWAILLGKALFWDQQVGSDGQSCASCHYHAGADTRTVNSLSPGFLKQPAEDRKFGAVTSFDGEAVRLAVPVGATRSGGLPVDAGYTLKPGDFPLYELSDYLNRNSPITYATDDGVGAAGSFDSAFQRAQRFLTASDRCAEAEGDIFHVGSLAARQVAPRNTPTTINAVFNASSFWDGRANRQFNGVGVFGPRDIAGDPRKRLIVPDAAGRPSLDFLQVQNASLASQAVGPALSEKEMSCSGRTFADLGRKMLLRRPLALQKVHAQDSVFGTAGIVRRPDLIHVSGRGLSEPYRYAELIKKAFNEKYWKLAGRYVIGPTGQLQIGGLTGYTQMEQNFSMFWGLSIMLYEGTLVSDQSRFDTWLASCNLVATNPSGSTVPIGNPVVTCRPGPASLSQSTDPTQHGFTAQEAMGWGLFNNGGTGIRNPGNPACNGCHNGPAVFSEAQFTATPAQPFGATFLPVERSRIDDRGPGTPNIPLPTAEQRAAGQLSTVEGAVHDRGFFNIGSRPTSLDLGNGGTDPYGNPLSVSRMFLAEQIRRQLGDTRPVADPTGLGDPCNPPGLIEGGFPTLAQAPEVNQGRYPGCQPATLPGTTTPNPAFPGTVSAGFDWRKERALVDGAFKTPTLRNIGLTPPYFHFGGYANLRDVVRFYARGGSRRDKSLVEAGLTGDTSGTGPLGGDLFPLTGPHFGTNVDFFVRDVKSTEEQVDALVAFMLTLTDPRVQCDLAPFDHPSLRIAVQPLAQDLNRDGRADDQTFELPETGAQGYDPASGLCIPNTGDLFSPGMQSRSGGLALPLPRR